MLPSEESPLMALRLAKVYEEAGLPPGCFNVVTGFGHEIGDALTDHPLVRSISFTGSTRVGTHIRELAGRSGKKLTLELGGKSPLVVLDDADLSRAVQAAVLGSFGNQGQICMIPRP
jgi:acyl-CoA reductase-like NAD-dependent aldehyde dehydrogenase